MTTTTTPVLQTISYGWEKQYKSGVNSGVVGDLAHKINGGYHISIQDQPSNNYSVTRKDDKAPPGTWCRTCAAAIDQSMNKADMITCYNHVHTVWADHTDPRRAFFNAFNVWDGSGDAVRLDFVANTATFASEDHTWHVHGELRRRWVNDPRAARAWLSMTGGQPKNEWMLEELVLMAMTPADMEATLVALASRVYGQTTGTTQTWIDPRNKKSHTETPIVTAKLISDIQKALATPALVIDLDALADKIAERLKGTVAK
jgi:hypothetical protein